MSVSSKLAGIGAGAALALFAYTPSAAADTVLESHAAGIVVGTIARPLPAPTQESVRITVQRPSKGQIVPLQPMYQTMCGFCAGIG